MQQDLDALTQADDSDASATWNDMIVGSFVILLSYGRGPIGERYGTYERFIR